MAAGWRNVFTRLYSERIRRQAAKENFFWFMSCWLKTFVLLFRCHKNLRQTLSLKGKWRHSDNWRLLLIFRISGHKWTRKDSKHREILSDFFFTRKKVLPQPGKQEASLWEEKRSNCVLLFLTMGLQLKSQRSASWPLWMKSHYVHHGGPLHSVWVSAKVLWAKLQWLNYAHVNRPYCSFFHLVL